MFPQSMWMSEHHGKRVTGNLDLTGDLEESPFRADVNNAVLSKLPKDMLLSDTVG